MCLLFCGNISGSVGANGRPEVVKCPASVVISRLQVQPESNAEFRVEPFKFISSGTADCLAGPSFKLWVFIERDPLKECMDFFHEAGKLDGLALIIIEACT